jgi:hypothetical protein
MLALDVADSFAFNPLFGFSKVNSKAYTFTPAGAQEQPAILAAVWEHSLGAACPGTISTDVGQSDAETMERPPLALTTVPHRPCEQASAADRQALLATLLQRRRTIAAEKGTHDNYTSVEWVCRPDRRPTAWVTSQFLGTELWEQTATGPKASYFGRPLEAKIVQLGGAADFDGDGAAQLVFWFAEPAWGPPYDTDIKVRHGDRLQVIAHATREQPEPFWQIVRLPGSKRDAVLFHAGKDWNWERTPPKLIGIQNGRFVDLPRFQKQFFIDATASERRALRKRSDK